MEGFSSVDVTGASREFDRLAGALAFPPRADDLFEARQTRPGRDTKKQLLHDLRGAIAGSQLELEFQPIVDSVTERLTSLEALLRWNHPEKGRISPSVFIPLAEQSSIIGSITEWVVHKACREAAKWPEPLNVTVNLSASRFNKREIARVVAEATFASGLRLSRLGLELTETVMLADERRFQSLSQLQANGVSILLDDFGTGYSSLSSLHRFAFDKIKIDRCFIYETEKCRHSYRMLEALMRFTAALGVPTVVEGVETPEQLRRVRAFGPCEIQGYVFAKPMRAAEVPSFIASWRR